MGRQRGLYILVFTSLVIATSLRAQTEPTDPLMLLNQQDRERAANATQAAQMAADLQRRQLQEMHGTNGTGADVAKAPQLADLLTDTQVRVAMSGGVDYLLKRLATTIAGDGSFRGIPVTEQRPWIGFAGDQQVGLVSLDIYALLEAGRALDDPRLRPSSPQMQPLVKWLLKTRTHQTYSAALQASALSALPQSNDVKFVLKRICDDLIVGMRTDGAFTYSLTEYPPVWDNSNTQYALLGMWAASEAGVEVPNRFWQVTDAHWRKTQSASGGWAYEQPADASAIADANSAITPALTAAGVASLFVTLDHRRDARVNPLQDRGLTRGLAAVAADFQHNLPVLGDDLYYTYALQRVGVASGLKYIDGINWYRRAAAAIVLSQRPNGAWSYAYSELTGTAYALLVLAHGGSPVIFNKLEYPGPSEWNAYPRDDANLTRRIGQLVEQPLNWQSVTLQSEAEDWLDGAILLVTGKGDPQFTAADIQRLRTFVEDGGLVFSVAQEDDAAFTAAMKKYASVVVNGKYDGRRLPADHPIFTLEEKVSDPASPPELWGMSNGVRELWVHSPVDFAASWQHFAYGAKDHWAIPVNLYVYVTGKNRPRSRLHTLRVPPVSTPTPATDSPSEQLRMSVARLRMTGNCDPEPGAWPRLAKVLFAEANILLELKEVEIGGLDARTMSMAHMTGTERFELDEAARGRLAEYVASGGTLFADAAGGSEAFAASFGELVKGIAPGAEREVLSGDHLMFSGLMKGSVRLDRDSTGFRKATPLARRVSGRPEIWAWKVGGRYAVFFSPLDVTSGLLGTETWGIAGYSPETSEALARDMVLYAVNGRGR